MWRLDRYIFDCNWEVSDGFASVKLIFLPVSRKTKVNVPPILNFLEIEQCLRWSFYLMYIPFENPIFDVIVVSWTVIRACSLLIGHLVR